MLIAVLDSPLRTNIHIEHWSTRCVWSGSYLYL